MTQSIDFTGFVSDFLLKNFFHIDEVAQALLFLLVFFAVFWLRSLFAKKLTTPAKYAPSVMTAAGLCGTFIGLTYGLKDVSLKDADSMQQLIDSLKLVFIYSLFGVSCSVMFMLLNMWPTALQLEDIKKKKEKNTSNINDYNGQLLDILNKQSIIQNGMAQDIAKLKFDNDSERLGEMITQGIVNGLSPLLLEIKTAIADQGSEAIKQVLEDLKVQILIPMKGALENTNIALDTTNQAVIATISAIKEAQSHNDKLIDAVGQAAISIKSASSSMEQASQQMYGLVEEIDDTVSHMARIQEEQKISLNQFNADLETNLTSIQPAIEEGMASAERSLTAAIDSTSKVMQRDIKQVLLDTTSELKDTIGVATQSMITVNERMDNLVGKIDKTVAYMGQIQEEQKTSLNQFNADLQSNLATIQPAIEQGMAVARESLVSAISTSANVMQYIIKQASEAMTENISSILNTASQQLNKSVEQATGRLTNAVSQSMQRLNESVDNAFKQFDSAQQTFDQTLQAFSVQMNGHLDRMASELKAIGENAESMINKASLNLQNTLGDIDLKLLNTADVLKTSLEVFRIEYQERLQEFLTKQNTQMGDFLKSQNEQLEKTLGEQRRGLEAVTQQLTEQFAQMIAQQQRLDSTRNDMIVRLEATEHSLLSKVQTIAYELSRAEKQMTEQLELSGLYLNEVAGALHKMGEELPVEFSKAFEKLNTKYIQAFSDMDGGMARVTEYLVDAVGGLTQSLSLHNALK